MWGEEGQRNKQFVLLAEKNKKKKNKKELEVETVIELVGNIKLKLLIL